MPAWPPAERRGRRAEHPSSHATRSTLGRTSGDWAAPKRILAGYVHQALAQLPGAAGPCGRRSGLGQAILKVMVTSQKTKAALAWPEIGRFLEEAGGIKQTMTAAQERARPPAWGWSRCAWCAASSEAAWPSTSWPTTPWPAKIATWISQEEMAAKAVRELLRREVDDWQQPAC